jgi:hypothetical protein
VPTPESTEFNLYTLKTFIQIKCVNELKIRLANYRRFSDYTNTNFKLILYNSNISLREVDLEALLL